MSAHPDFAIGDVLLRRGDPFAASVVIDGYDAISGMLRWTQPATGITGIGPATLYQLAPERWQDAPRPINYIADSGECRSRLAAFHLANIAWATRHLVRVDTGLAVEALWNSRTQLESLEACAA